MAETGRLAQGRSDSGLFAPRDIEALMDDTGLPRPANVRQVLANLQKTRRRVSSEEGAIMVTIRILHHHAPGYGWSFDSPDVAGLTGGADSYDPVHAEDAARFALSCAAEEQGVPVPTDLTFEHYVPAGVAVVA
jgi:hypothetical protein